MRKRKVWVAVCLETDKPEEDWETFIRIALVGMMIPVSKDAPQRLSKLPSPTKEKKS